jgi:hypothetical protein
MLVMIIGKLGWLVKSVFVPYSRKALAQIAILGSSINYAFCSTKGKSQIKILDEKSTYKKAPPHVSGTIFTHPFGLRH